MKANTALAFALAGVSLRLLAAERSPQSRSGLGRRAGQLCATQNLHSVTDGGDAS
jgi:hypothetical protein